MHVLRIAVLAILVGLLVAHPEVETRAKNPRPRQSGGASQSDNFFTKRRSIVRPGTKTLSRALRKARKGQTLILRPGVYREDEPIEVAQSVRIVGSDRGRTILRVPGIGVTGGPVVLRNLDFVVEESGDETNAILSFGVPVRVERCRFENFSLAVVLKEAPLCDVVQCEFIRCRFGVWINDGASPTIWGCRFEDCVNGVGCREGTPYLADNLFLRNKRGVSLRTKGPTIVRNNVFVRSGAELLGASEDPRIPVAVLYNSVFYDSPAVELSWHAQLSHNLFYPAREPRWSAESGEVKEGPFFTFDPGYADVMQGRLAITSSSRLIRAGFLRDLERFGRQNDAPNTIGLSDPQFVPGVHASADAPAPYRWTEPFIINSVGEGSLLVRNLPGERKVVKINRAIDQLIDTWILDDGEVRFDIARFFPANIVH